MELLQDGEALKQDFGSAVGGCGEDVELILGSAGCIHRRRAGIDDKEKNVGHTFPSIIRPCTSPLYSGSLFPNANLPRATASSTS